MNKQDVIFVLTIDTEEEWLWEEKFPDHDFSVKNVERIPAFQAFCDKIGIRSTYFVDYAVAENKHAKDIMVDIARNTTSEIGAHLHPWCNPPYFGETTDFESHVINLPDEQVITKLDALTERLITEFNVTPTSFRSGRWGIDGRGLRNLHSRGYKVDSSVYPFYENEFFSCKGAPNKPYWPSYNDPLQASHQRDIMEIPVSAGFNVKDFEMASNMHDKLSSPYLGWTKTIGLLWHTRILRKLYLSPELTTTKDMCTLVDFCLKNQNPVIHMYLHSSSLIDGATGLLDKNNSFALICQRIEDTVNYLQQRSNLTFATISEAAAILKQSPECTPVINWQESAL
ncbi:polysaccharide deacetylase family protein [Alteromonas sp. 5E99-2]|uniref:polysaccharide deacetylase family protein n=1 Tax=Alteromonas sp. 5E99-2 TaxID=2817683 RepID=UPI001A986BB9|nr:polysaccharide deacetylase family protein [Alteromonas sp. 5E99-2]MBO1256537.1 polysaccharide deacetylase family protein [Alteromonas sp. 5E99-2]